MVDRSPGLVSDAQTDLWLREADIIEVPDKGAAFTPRQEVPGTGAAPAK